MLRTILEVILCAVVIWSIFNEDKFTAFEDSLKTKIKTKIWMNKNGRH